MDKSQIRDYVLLMLGAPVLQIELDEKQIDFIIDSTEDKLRSKIEQAGFKLEEEVNSPRYNRFMQEGALWGAMVVLGRIRRKFKSILPDGSALDGKDLSIESLNLKEQWVEEVNLTWPKAQDHPLFEKILLELIKKGHHDKAVDIAKSIVAKLNKK